MRNALNQVKTKASAMWTNGKERLVNILGETSPSADGGQAVKRLGKRAAVVLLIVVAGSMGAGYVAYKWWLKHRAGQSAPVAKLIEKPAREEPAPADDSEPPAPAASEAKAPRGAAKPARGASDSGKVLPPLPPPQGGLTMLPPPGLPESTPPAPASKPAASVKTEMAVVRDLSRHVHAIGEVKPDERRIHVVEPRFAGWIEELHAGATGQTVQRGQVLLEAYSPQLNAVQKEYLLARSGAAKEGGSALGPIAAASLKKLENLGIADEDLQQLQDTGKPARTLALRSPASGILLEKRAVRGKRFRSGDTLFRIANLGKVWVVADVAEYQVAGVKAGQPVVMSFDAYPGRTFSATLEHVYPTANPRTRSVPVRVLLNNKHGLFKPGMRVSLDIRTGDYVDSVVIPSSAVIKRGARQAVLVKTKSGRLAPREVWLGPRRQHQVAVLRGISEGEQVAVSGESALTGNRRLRTAVDNLFSDAGRRMETAPREAYRAVGTIEDIDRHAGTILISHGPVPALQWQANALDFTAADESLLRGAATGQKIRFEFVLSNEGEYVVTRILGRAR